MPWESGAEEIVEFSSLVTIVHRGRAHYNLVVIGQENANGFIIDSKEPNFSTTD